MISIPKYCSGCEYRTARITGDPGLDALTIGMTGRFWPKALKTPQLKPTPGRSLQPQSARLPRTDTLTYEWLLCLSPEGDFEWLLIPATTPR
jgi:hypothetical protein